MLKGFQKITLAPGETRKVAFDLGPESLAFWGAGNRFGVEPARVTIWIAANKELGMSKNPWRIQCNMVRNEVDYDRKPCVMRSLN